MLLCVEKRHGGHERAWGLALEEACRCCDGVARRDCGNLENQRI